MRVDVQRFLEKKTTTYFIAGVIVANAIVLGLETIPSVFESAGSVLKVVDKIFLSLFILELFVKMYAYKFSFFKSGWNIFDATIVGLTMLPFLPGMEALSALRVLRILRLLAVIPQMRYVVGGLFKAIPGLVSVLGLLVILLYVSAILCAKLLGAQFPELFGSLGASLFSLFQIMTLEGWANEIVRPVMDVYPLAGFFFILFIIFSTFAVLNLVIGVMVNAMQKAHEESEREILEETASIEREIKEVRALLERIESKMRS